MIKRLATQEQIKYVKEYLDKGFTNPRIGFQADKSQILFGHIAQIIVTDALHLPRPENQGMDGGYDIEWNNKTWDIKCNIRTVPFKPRLFVHNVAGRQINNKVHGYIFVSYDKTSGLYTICGWITKAELLQYAMYFPEGSTRTRTDGSLMTIASGCGGIYELKHKYLKEMKR
jgi:hypothetical protein